VAKTSIPPSPPSPEQQPPNPEPVKRKHTKSRKSKFRQLVAQPPKLPKKPNPAIEAIDVPQPPQAEAEPNDDSNKDILDGLFYKAFERWISDEDANKGVSAIAKVVSYIQAGKSLKELDAELIPLLSEQQAKSHILQAMMYNHQMERIALHWSSRWNLERSLWEDLNAKNLTPREKIALLQIATREAKDAAAYINGASTPFTPMTEVEPTIEKAGKHSASKALADKKKEFEGTTPQGREIIRRFTFKAKQAASRIVDTELSNEKKSDGGKPQ